MKAARRAYDFIYDVYRRFSEDAGTFLAATISYYALFSIFPLLLLAISAAGYVVTYFGKGDVLRYTGNALPHFSGVISANVRSIAANRRSTGIVGLLILLWSGTAVFDAVDFAMNKVWKVPVRRHFILSKLLSIAAVISVILLLVLTTVVSTAYETFQRYSFTSLKVTPPLAALSAINLLVSLVVVFVCLIVIYAVVPNVKLRIVDVWVGAALATGAWETAKRVFAMYMSRATRFNAIYGSVGVYVGLLFWLYISGVILVLGAEINAALRTAREEPRTPAS